MKKNTLGRTGMNVSRIALGGFPFGGIHNARGWDPYTDDGKELSHNTTNTALDIGISYIDTAPPESPD